MAVQFVVLHHTGVEPEHYDLLLAFPGEPLLRTWRVLTPPERWAGDAPVAVRQADHRAVYLTYEGDISNGRGRVRRVMAGEASVLAESQTSCTVELRAQNFSCTLELPLIVA